MEADEAFHRFAQTLDELSFQARRAAEIARREWSQWDLEAAKLAEVALPAQVEALDLIAPVESEPEPPSNAEVYPKLVDRTTIDWDTLRLTTLSKLSALMREGVYHPRVNTDKGYMWLAEQLGNSGAIRDFLVGGSVTMSAESFIRLCQWLGYPPSEFVDYKEGV